MTAMTVATDRLLITVAPTGAETAKDDVPQLPTTLEELVETARRCEAAGAAMIHVHIRDDEHRPTLDLGRLTDDGGRAARGHRPRRPALHRRLGARPARAAAEGARRAAGLVQPDDGHHQLRRRRVPQPVAVRLRPLPAQPGARGGARVRAVRPRPRGRAAPAARHVRPAVRREGARRPRDGRPRRHARHRRRARRGRGRPARRGHVAGRPPASAAPRWRWRSLACPRAATCGSAWRTCSPSPRASRSSTTSSSSTARRARSAGPAHADDDRRGARAAAASGRAQ